MGLGFHPIFDSTRRNTRDVVIDWHPQDAVDKKYTLVDKGVAGLPRRATRGYVIQLSSGAAQYLTSGVYRILGLVRVDPEDVVGELDGRAVSVRCVEGYGVQYDEGAGEQVNEKKLKGLCA